MKAKILTDQWDVYSILKLQENFKQGEGKDECVENERKWHHEGAIEIRWFLSQYRAQAIAFQSKPRAGKEVKNRKQSKYRFIFHYFFNFSFPIVAKRFFNSLFTVGKQK